MSINIEFCLHDIASFDTTDSPMNPGSVEDDERPEKEGQVNQLKMAGVVAQPSDASDGPPEFSVDSQTTKVQHPESDLSYLCKIVQSLPEDQRKCIEMLVDDVHEERSKLNIDRRTGLVTIQDVKLQTMLKARVPENTLKMTNVSHASQSDKEFEVNVFCDFLDALKSNSVPEGLVFFDTFIRPGSGKRYKERLDFKQQDTILGKGLHATVTVAIDNLTSRESAKKTVSINNFRTNEVRAMFALNSSNVTPILYGVQFHDRSITLFMEILKGQTIKNLITRLESVKSESDNRVGFALLTLNEILKGLKIIHSVGWFHRDLHSENVKIEIAGKNHDKSLNIKFLDFGNSFSSIYDIQGVEDVNNAWIKDYSCVLKLFCCLVMRNDDAFEDIFDFKNSYDRVLKSQATLPAGDLCKLIQSGLQVRSVEEENGFIDFLSPLICKWGSHGQFIINQLAVTDSKFTNIHSRLPNTNATDQSECAGNETAHGPQSAVTEDWRQTISNVTASIRDVKLKPRNTAVKLP